MDSFKSMTLVQLEYIIAVEDTRHFGKAAERCFVTQPTLSMQIQKLEEGLGITIFDRKKQPISPTALGNLIIAQARHVLQEAKKIKEIIEEEQQDVTGEVNMGVIPTLAPYLLPLFVPPFIDHHPQLSLRAEEMVTNKIIERLKLGTLDMALIVTPTGDSDLVEKPLFYEEFFAYISLRHPLFNKEKLHMDDVAQEDIWLLNEGHCFRNQVLNICHAQSDSRSRKGFRYESGSLEGLKKIVDRYGGMTLLPELATLDFDKASQQRLRYFVEPKPIREVSLVMTKDFMKRKTAKALHDAILSAIPNYIKSEKNGQLIQWR